MRKQVFKILLIKFIRNCLPNIKKINTESISLKHCFRIHQSSAICKPGVIPKIGNAKLQSFLNFASPKDIHQSYILVVLFRLVLI